MDVAFTPKFLLAVDLGFDAGHESGDLEVAGSEGEVVEQVGSLGEHFGISRCKHILDVFFKCLNPLVAPKSRDFFSPTLSIFLRLRLLKCH